MRKPLSTLSFLVCSLLFWSGCGGDSDRSVFRRGLDAYRAKDYAKAGELLTRAAQRITGSAELYYYLGSARLSLGELDAAYEAFSLATDCDAQHGESLAGMGQVAFLKNELPKARGFFEEALRVRLTTPEASASIYNGLFLVYREQKELARARLALFRALKLAPQYAVTIYNLGTLYCDGYQLYQEALDQFQMYLAVAEKDDPYREKAQRHIRRLQEILASEKAAQEAKRASAPERNVKEAQECLDQALELQSKKRYSQAIKVYRRALEADPFSFHAALGLGTLLARRDEYVPALAAFQKAAELNPVFLDSYVQAAEQAFQLRRYAEVEKMLATVFAREPFHLKASELMIRTRIAQKRIEEAKEFCAFYLTLLKPDDPRYTDYEKWLKTAK